MSARHRKHALYLAALGALASSASVVSAAEWDAEGADTNWSTIENWTLNTPPGAGEAVTFSTTGLAVAGTPTNTVGANTSIGQLNYLQIDGTLAHTTNIASNTTLTTSGLTVKPAAASTSTVGSGAVVVITGAAGSTLTMSAGTVTVTGMPTVDANNAFPESRAVLDLRGLSTFTYNRASGGLFLIGSGNNTSADRGAYSGTVMLAPNTNISSPTVSVGGQSDGGTVNGQRSTPVSLLTLGQNTRVNTGLTGNTGVSSGNFSVGYNPNATSRAGSGAIYFQAGLTDPTLQLGASGRIQNQLTLARADAGGNLRTFGVIDTTSASGGSDGELNAWYTNLYIGNGAAGAGGGAGMLSLNKGTVSSGEWIFVARTRDTTNAQPIIGQLNVGVKLNESDAGEGKITITSTDNARNYLIIGHRTNGTGTGHVSEGTLNVANSGIVDVARIIVGENGGGAGAGAIQGVVNLGGGSVLTQQIRAGADTNTGNNNTRIVNFDGGTLVVRTGSAQVYRDAFLQGHTASYVYDGGATVDTNGQAATINQNLLAPGADGITAIAVTNGGSGYKSAPIVRITGGGGVGASAVAKINAAGVVTGIVVTNPGSGYTSTPTIDLIAGGGATYAASLVPYGGTAAVLNPTIGSSASGGINKIGAGTLTLGGSSTFTGATTITAGTLALAASASIASSSILVGPTAGNSTATLDLTTSTFIVGGGASDQTLAGFGQVTGTLNVGDNGTLSPGVGTGIGTLSTGDVSLSTGSVTRVQINSDAVDGEFDRVISSGQIAYGGTLEVAFSEEFDDSNEWNLFDFASFAGNFASVVDVNNVYDQLVFNQTTGVLSVPEPASLSVLALGAGGLLSRRRRRRAGH